MCKLAEEMRDHLLLYCSKAWILWQLIFALFNVPGMMYPLVRWGLVSWSGFLVGRKDEGSGKLFLYVCFGYLEKRDKELLRIRKVQILLCKTLYLDLLYDGARVYVYDITSLLDFVDWLGPP